MIRRNRGTYAVTSGTQTVVGYRVKAGDREDVYAHARWSGTIVTMIVDLQNRLPLDEVYNTLPLPPGMTTEDFFED